MKEDINKFWKEREIKKVKQNTINYIKKYIKKKRIKEKKGKKI